MTLHEFPHSHERREWVRTADIKAAVQGHEMTVLGALRIAYGVTLNGRHIRCPYPTHDDRNPSWRWNERDAKAHCTCDPSHDIFDVVQKMEGCDFEEAKLYIARAISRHDLIRHTPEPRSEPRSKPNGSAGALFPPRTPPDKNGKPLFIVAGDDGPPPKAGDIRRHVSRRDGVPVRVKIKYAGNGTKDPYANWYRVADTDGTTGWQSGKPIGYADVPYVTYGANPFDPEALQDRLNWPEGEKDTDTITNRLGGLAFAFGGVGDGLPKEMNGRWSEFLAGRDVVILADNDAQGRKHAQDKAVVAKGAGARSVRVIDFKPHFPDLMEKGDVTDLVEDHGLTPEQYSALVDAQPEWEPPKPGPKPQPGPAFSGQAQEPSQDSAPLFSNEDLALKFATQYAEELRFVANWGRWMQWDSTKWCRDSTLATFDKARALCRLMANIYFATSTEERKRV
jgi:hypothetical protein